MTVLQRDCNDVIIPWEDAPEGYDYWIVDMDKDIPSNFHRWSNCNERYVDEKGGFWDTPLPEEAKVYERTVDSKPSENESVEVSKVSDATLQDMTKTLSESITVTVAGTYEVFSLMVDEVVEFKDVNLLTAYVEEYKIIMKLLGKEV